MENDPVLIEMGEFFNQRGADYDRVHTSAISGGIESKNILASFLPEGTKTLLDLGIGTGLELTALYRRFPDIEVTGVDMASGMLELCRKRCGGKKLTLLNMSYFDYPYGQTLFDAVMSVMTLHHYTHEVKTEMYKQIRRSLKPGGVYIESDYVITERGEQGQKLEDFYFSELARMRKEQGCDDSLEYHYDTPCTVENQLKMLKDAGFTDIEIMREYERNLIVRAKNP